MTLGRPTSGKDGLKSKSERGKTAIDEQIAIAAELGKQGRFVPQWDHLIPPDVSWENFSYACKRLQEVCYQTR